MQYPVTPDGRYFLVKGRLWRCTNPHLAEDQRDQLVSELMSARRALKGVSRGSAEEREARARVHAAKVALGERGPVWWSDGAPDFNRQMAKDTPYSEWAQQQEA